MMTLKACLSKSNWIAVSSALANLFPDCVEGMADYQSAYEQLKQLDTVIGKTRLTIGRYAPESILSFYVVGFEDECPKGFTLKFSPWRHWLGAYIGPLLLRQYQIAEVCAICLYDMTWAGFSTEAVANFRKFFIHHEDCLSAVFGYGEMIKDSEPNPIKRQQRSNEFFEALGLYDFDELSFSGDESLQYCEVWSHMENSQ